MQKVRIRLTIATILLFIAAGICAYLFLFPAKPKEEPVTVAPQQPITNGQTLFNANCAPCHHPLKELIGPPLQNVEQRLSKELIYLFIREPGKAEKKSKYLRELIKKYEIKHYPFPTLTDKDIDAILHYTSEYIHRPAPAVVA